MRKVDICMAKDKVMDMEMEFDFDALTDEVFGSKAVTAKLNPGLQGKIFLVTGSNSTGKTSQCAKMVKNSYIFPFEPGTNALTGTKILTTATWADALEHFRKLTKNKKLLQALKQGHTIGVIFDGLEVMSLMMKDYICDQMGVEKFKKAGSHGSQWEDYATEISRFFYPITRVGYTIFFITHPAESKEIPGYLDLACEKRIAKVVKDLADFSFYIQSNGSDENDKVIPSTAYLVERMPTEDTYGWFARCRFPHVQTKFEEWDAEIVKQAIYDGIVKQAEIEGAELGGFEEEQEKYRSSFTLTYEEAMDKIFNMLDTCDEKELSEKADDILLQYLDSVDDVNNLKEKQMMTIQSILDELSHLLETNE